MPTGDQNEVLIVVTADDQSAPGLDAAAARIKSLNEQGAASTVAASDEEVAALALVEAQYNQVATASEAAASAATQEADALAAEAEATRAAAEAAAIMAQRELELADAARIARDSLLPDVEVVDQIAASSARAAAAVANFARIAEEGTPRVARAAVPAKLAIQDLERAIESARANGLPVAPETIAQLTLLQAGYEKATLRAGEYKAAQRLVNEELRAAQRSAGDYEGSFRSLRDVVSTVSPSLGKVAGNLEGIAVGGFLAVETLKILAEVTKKVGEEGAKLLAANLADADAEMRLVSGETTRYAQNLRDVLSKQGYDVASASLQVLIGYEEEFEQRLRQREIQQAKIVAEAVGDQKKIIDGTAAAIGAYREVAIAAADAAEPARLVAKALELQIDKYLAIGIEGPAALLKGAEAAREVEARHHATQETLEAIRIALFAQIDTYAKFGKTVPAALLAAEDAYLKLSLTQGLNAQQAKNLLGEIEKEIAQYERIGKAVPEFLQRARIELSAMALTAGEARAAHEKLLEAIGVQTPEAVDKEITAIQAAATEFTAGGKISVESASLLIAKIEAVRVAVSKMPEGARAGFAGMVAGLESIKAKLEETADVVLQEFGIQAPDKIKRSTVAVEALAAAFGPLGKVTKEQAERVVAEAKKILEAIALLPPAERNAVSEQVVELRKLVTTYGEVAAKKKSFYVDVEAIEKKAAEGIKQYVAESIAAYERLIKEIKAVDDAKKTAAKDDAAARQKELESLQNPTGPLTADQEARLNELQDSLGRTSDSTNTLSKSIGLLGDQNVKTNATIGQVNDLIDGQVKIFENNTEAYHKLGAAGQAEFANIVTGLQRAQEEGTASADFIEGQLSKVRQLASDAGVGNDELAKSFSGVSDQSNSLNARLSSLDTSSSKLSDTLDGLSGTSGDVATSQGTLQDSMKKTADVILQLGKDGRQAIRSISVGLAGAATKAKELAADAGAARKQLEGLGSVSF